MGNHSWDTAPIWANYKANDLDGRVFWYEDEPFTTEYGHDVKTGRYEEIVTDPEAYLKIERRPLLSEE